MANKCELLINVVKSKRSKRLSDRGQNGNAAGVGACESPTMGMVLQQDTLPANRESLNRSRHLCGTW